MIDKFIDKEVISIFILLTLINHLLQITIKRFQSYITNIMADAKNVCLSYVLFIPFEMF